MSSNRVYLGDSVYAHDDGFHIVLTGNANGRENEIYLDRFCISELLKFLEQQHGVSIKVSKAPEEKRA